MTESVLVVGCGIFGLSTALELAKKGIKVKAIDLYPVPSKWSASNDINKIIRTEYSDIFYARLSVEALSLWENDPLYKDVYFKSGRVTLSPASAENQHRAKFEEQGFNNLKELGVDVSGIKTIKSGKELGDLFPEFGDNSLGEISARYNPNAGYGHAANSLTKVYEEAKKLGVEFVFGPEGNVKFIINGDSVEVESGDVYTADKILIAAGAATGYLVDLKEQVKATGLFVTHIKLTDDEYEKYKDIPVFFSAELGYFFPPDAETRHIKIAMTYSDARNLITDPFDESKQQSLPRYKAQNTGDTFPTNGEAHVRHFLKMILPDLQNHQLVKGKVCWISDTTDSNFLIDYVPSMKNVLVATGDSGHGYKFLPNIGRYIADKILDKKQETDELSKRWGWKDSIVWKKQISSRAKRPQFDLAKDEIDWYKETEESHL